MALVKPLVLKNGVTQRLQAGDDLDAPTSELQVRTITNAESSAAIVIGAPTYIFSAGAVKKAKGDAVATADVFGLGYDTSIAAGGSGKVATRGTLSATTAQWDAVTGQVGGLTPGARYYLDIATAGKLTVTPPDTTGVCLSVGKALSATEFDIDIDTLVQL